MLTSQCLSTPIVVFKDTLEHFPVLTSDILHCALLLQLLSYLAVACSASLVQPLALDSDSLRSIGSEENFVSQRCSGTQDSTLIIQLLSGVPDSGSKTPQLYHSTPHWHIKTVQTQTNNYLCLCWQLILVLLYFFRWSRKAMSLISFQPWHTS